MATGTIRHAKLVPLAYYSGLTLFLTVASLTHPPRAAADWLADALLSGAEVRASSLPLPTQPSLEIPTATSPAVAPPETIEIASAAAPGSTWPSSKGIIGSGGPSRIGTNAVASTTVTFQQDVAGYTGTQDTDVHQNFADTPQGAGVSWKWDTEDPVGFQAFGLIRFDNIFGTNAGQIPVGSTITSATLTLVSFNATATPAGTINEVAVDWQASTATWNNFGGEAGVQSDEYRVSPSYTAPLFAGTLPVTEGINVTASLQSWSSNPALNFGWVFRPSSNDGAEVYSAEQTTVGQRPVLSVTYNAPTGCVNNSDCNDGNTCTTDTCDLGSGTCNHVTLSCAWGTCNPAHGQCEVTLSFQNGVSGYSGTVDTYLDEANPALSHANDVSFFMDNDPTDKQGLIRFDGIFGGNGTSQIPPGSTIRSATLTVNVNDPSDTGAAFHRMLSCWDDTNTWSTFGAGIQADGIEAVSTADFSALQNATGILTPVPDVTASVAAWSAGATNLGWAALPLGGSGWAFDSAQGTIKPLLTVKFTPPAACTTDANCNDGIGCTTDTCNVSTGFCSHAANVGANCSDGVACTTDTCSACGRCASVDGCISPSVCNTGTGQCASPPAPPSQPTNPSPADGATGVSTSPQLCVDVSDPNGDPLNVTFKGRQGGGGSGTPFTIIAMPDTQFYSESFPTTYESQTMWVRDNRIARNIVMSVGLGDCVNVADVQQQWINANAANSILENPATTGLTDGIPYGIAVGNHDQAPNGNARTGTDENITTLLYNQTFPKSRFQGRAYFGGQYSLPGFADSMDNHYELFSGSGMDFIVFHNEWDEGNCSWPADGSVPTGTLTTCQNVMVWMRNLLVNTYPNRRAIVATHFVGTPSAGGSGTMALSNQGQAYLNMVKALPNVFMMLGGHLDQTNFRQDLASDGHTIFTITTDYQTRPNGGNGWFRIMTFDPVADTIHIETYSPTVEGGRFINRPTRHADDLPSATPVADPNAICSSTRTNSCNELLIPYDMDAGLPFQTIGTTTNVPSGTRTCMSWPGLTANLVHEWKVEVSDATATTTSVIRSFTTSSCTVNADCDDANVCTTDVCSNTVCSHDAVAGCCNVNADCTDGNPCNGTETCSSHTCQAGAAPSCNDGNACTTDSCVNPTGCAHAYVPTSGCCGTNADCNDGNPATTDTCTAGDCSNPVNATCTTSADCNDADVCTSDLCVGGNASGLSFDGIDDYVDLGNAASLNDFGTGSFTIEGWIYTDGGANDRTGIVRFGQQGSHAQVAVQLSGAGAPYRNLTASVETNVSPSQMDTPITSAATLVPVNTWTHFAVVVDRDSLPANPGNQVLRLYINGTEVSSLLASAAAQPWGTNVINAPDNVLFGAARADGGALTAYYDGRIDEMRIWSGVRTPSQIQSSMNLEIASYDGLLHRWGLNDVSGNTAVDDPGVSDGALKPTPPGNAPSWVTGSANLPNLGTGTCSHSAIAGCCTSAAQCNDANPCTNDTCVSNACQHAFAAGNACDDGNAATCNDICTTGSPVTNVVGTLNCTENQALSWNGTTAFINVEKAWTHSYTPITAPIISASLSIEIGDADSGPLSLVSGSTSLGSITGGDNGGPGSFLCQPPGFATTVLTIPSSLYADIADGTFQVSTTGCTPTCAGAPAGVGTYALSHATLQVQTGTCQGTTVGCCVVDADCNDGNACTTDTCTTGQCFHTNGNEGGACSDGNACTQTDTCVAGVCTGANPVVCTASDQCHDAGTCNTSTGACTNPAKANGSTCNDGLACTTSDVCTGGVCGGTAVVCTASDQCHVAGTCDTQSGLCSNPAATDGTNCNDANACTNPDVCTAGVCTGSPINCDDGNQCTADSCSAGVCQHTSTPGAACDDGNACTTGDTCAGANVTSVMGTQTCTESQALTWNGTTAWINIDKAWTHSYAAISGTIVSATLAIEIGDADSGPLTIVSGATTLGTITGGDNGGPGTFACTAPGFADNVLTIPSSLYADLADGSFNVSTSGCNPTCASAPTGPGTYGFSRAILTIQVAPTCGGTQINCDDGDVCTADSCSGGTCQHAAIAGCCNTASECDDGNACTADSCASHACQHLNTCCVTNADCNDNDACTTDVCTTGTCSHTTDVCNDGNTCTTDTCSGAAVSSALDFNGTTQSIDFLTAADHPELGLSQFTLEAWIFRKTGGATGSSGTGGIVGYPIIAKGVGEGDNSNVDANYFFAIDQATGKLAADFEEAAGQASPGLNHPIFGNTAVSLNTWHHVAVTYDGSTWKLYLDGSPDGTLAVGRLPRADSIQRFAIGTATNSTGTDTGAFSGTIDEPRVWNYARSQAEIQGTMGRRVTAAPGLVGRWGFDEVGGSTVADSIGVDGLNPNGRNPGTLVNAPTRVTGVPNPPAPATFGATQCTYSNVSNGTSCSDGNACTTGETCTTGVCGSGSTVAGCCNTAADCNDSDQCTTDTCVSNSCQHSAIANCCITDAACNDSNTCTTDSCNTANVAAVELDGTNDYIDLGNDGNTANVNYLTNFGTNNFTIEGWFWADTFTTDLTTVFRMGSQGAFPQVVVQLRTGTKLAASIDTGPPGAQVDTTAGLQPVFTLGAWHHFALAVVRDLVSPFTNQRMNLYLDGVLAESTPASGWGANPINDSILSATRDSVLLGAVRTGPGVAPAAPFLDGRLDEIRIWNSARTAQQISDNKNKQIVAATGLMHRWAMNEGSGTSVADSVGTNNGTLTNGPTWRTLAADIPTLGNNTCTFTAVSNGTACSDGNACTVTDTCVSGACTSGSPATSGTACGSSSDTACDNPDTCNGSGVCQTNTESNGTSCSDGNACTAGDSCQSGSCQSGTPVTCNAPPPCHTAVGATCDSGTGTCTYPVATDGTSCSDGNACTTGDACLSGTCTPATSVTCTDDGNVCNGPESCNPTNGQCESGPPATSGTACSDGNACTQSDACNGAGLCVGTNPVTCPVPDQCHTAGVCDTQTGLCSNPIATNGTSCTDNNACTSGDTCQSGTCSPGTATVCTASDQCHVAGVCDTVTGQCSNPSATNGTSCTDNNACTSGDTCQSGTCSPGTATVCTASDQCHVAGVCDTVTGQCSNPIATNGTPCDDGNPNTTGDVCGGGVCGGTDLCAGVTCTALDQCHVAGVCDTQTGVCSNPNADDGTVCTDGNACTTGDTCQSGTCSPGTATVCTASDQCHVAGVCDTVTGQCSNPIATNGTSCTDNNACTANDSCQAGACAPGTATVCTASDQCHVAGVCDTVTGQCSNPIATNGTSCTDGNACTVSDTCQSGVCQAGTTTTCPDDGNVCNGPESCNSTSGQCESGPSATSGTACSDGNACTQSDACNGAGLCVGSNPVNCTASDQCHVAGVCDTVTGQCSNPIATNGTSCTDNNACTANDSCQAGACAPGTATVCTASDQCHVAGVCDTVTGQCSNPIATNGTSCTDNNACTANDSCQAGACAPGTATVCTASDQCHVAGVCDTVTGQCSNPSATNGTSCTDNNACTSGDTCQSGTCSPGTATVCTASDQCHVAGVCDTVTGQCSNPIATNGTSCTDNNACTANDSCQAGTCTPGTATVCTASDQCHVAGVCDTVTGQCSNPNATNGTSCTDNNACTENDSCQAGACAPGAATVCTALDQCHVAGVCNTGTGACSNPNATNGTSCTDGNACTTVDACQSGVCVGASPVICNDSNPCTDDACNTSSGSCVFVANDANACTDGNVCTSDACSSGACVHAASGSCGVSGTVLYYRDVAGSGSEPSSKPVPNVGIDRTQDAVADATTGSSGTYAFGSLSGNVTLSTVAKYGSPRASDHNGAISGTDAAQIARSAVGLVTFSTNQRIAGDVTGNGTISGLDAAQVARFAALLVDHFDVATATGSDWKFLRCDAYAFPGDPGCGAPAYNFTPLSQAETGKNFHAVLYGDVTGNWAPAALFSSATAGESPLSVGDRAAFAAVPSEAALNRLTSDSDTVRSPTTSPALISIEGSTIPLRVGERRQLTITIANADGILGLDLKLSYDPTWMSIVGVSSTGIATGWGVAHADLHGTDRISTYGVTPLAGTGAVLTVTVEGRAGKGRAIPLGLSAVANEGAIPLSVLKRSGVSPKVQ